MSDDRSEGDAARIVIDLFVTLDGVDLALYPRSYLRSHPPQTVLQRRKIVSAFLDKFVLPEAVEVEIPLPGWTDDLVGAITAAYGADVAEIAAMDGVEFLLP